MRVPYKIFTDRFPFSHYGNDLAQQPMSCYRNRCRFSARKIRSCAKYAERSESSSVSSNGKRQNFSVSKQEMQFRSHNYNEGRGE